MAERDTRSPDPDDWFAGDERAQSRRARSAAPDDWIANEPRSRRPPGRLAEYLPGQWAPIAAGAVVLVIVVIAWVAFTGDSTPTQVVTTNQVNTTPTLPTTTAAAATVPAPATTLKPGDTGAEVKKLQRALASLGYTVGKVDGDYGTATKTALSEFQTSQDLTPDGIFGTATRTALVKALNAG
jgi:murein L,D-transpeptidase YcbB/YkuD